MIFYQWGFIGYFVIFSGASILFFLFLDDKIVTFFKCIIVTIATMQQHANVFTNTICIINVCLW